MHEIDVVQIETTTACPAHCVMCPRDRQKRGHGLMLESIFWKAVEQSVSVGANFIMPFISGDPLADRRMVEFVEKIAERYPGQRVGWYTNAALLTKVKAWRLLKCGNIPMFNVSMQGGDKETYERNMGLNWDKVCKNVRDLIAVNKDLGNPSEIRLNMCVFSATDGTQDKFKELWGDDATICLGSFSNFGGMISDPLGDEPWLDINREVCNRATRHLYVYWNGDVGQCCFDLQHNVTYGNLATSNFKQIVASPKYKAMRQAHLSLDVANMPPCCVNCNSCKFNG